MKKLVLASTSPFRQQVLRKLNIEFDIHAPEINEEKLDNESPQELVTRLSEEKAKAVSPHFPNSLIVGSDQVAVLNNLILGKPHTHENARQQLSDASGHRVSFYTGLCLFNNETGNTQTACVPFQVHFRKLNEEQIDRYLKIEQPYNCAGSFKSEGLGISLFEKLEGDDPNTLIGLPLIQLIRFLDNEGITIP